jgi:hypothetical protein
MVLSRCYVDATKEGFSIESEMSVDDKNRFLIELIAQSSRVAAKVRPGSTRSKFVCPACWSSECDALNERQIELFRVLRRTANFNAYRAVNEEHTELCKKLKKESLKRY